MPKPPALRNAWCSLVMPLTIAGHRERVVGAVPLRALQRQAGGHGAIDVGIGFRLDVAAGKAGAGEQAEIGGDFLLEIDAQAGAAAILAHRGDVGRPAGDLGQGDGVLVGAEAGAGEKAGERDLAGMAPQLVAPLDLAEPLELAEVRIEILAVRHRGQIEHAGAQRPCGPRTIRRRRRSYSPRHRRHNRTCRCRSAPSS